MALACVSNTSSCTTLKPGHKRLRLCRRTKSKPQSPSSPCLGHRHWPFLGAHTCGITQRHSAPQTYPMWASMAGATHQPPRVRRSTGTHQALLTSAVARAPAEGWSVGNVLPSSWKIQPNLHQKVIIDGPYPRPRLGENAPWALARAGSYDLSNSGDRGTEMPRVSLTG